MKTTGVLDAVRGGVGFLTRIPTGTGTDAWEAFANSPTVFPVVGYIVGAVVSVPFVAAEVAGGIPDPVVGFAYLVVLYGVTGMNHLDGVADIGDASMVHGVEARRDVLKDTDIGTGGVFGVSAVVVGAGFAAVSTSRLPVEAAVAVVVASEVTAKTAMASVCCLGDTMHEGLGSEFVEGSSLRSLVLPLAVASPALLLAFPSTATAVVGGGGTAGVVFWWSERTLGGVNGDVLGAVNEISRLGGLYAGVVAWTVF